MAYAQKYMPEDWPAMLGGIQAWVRDQLPSPWIAVFGKQNAPQPPKPFVWVNLLGPPKMLGQEDEGSATRVPGIVVKVPATVFDGATYLIHINDPIAGEFDVAVIAGPDDTADSIALSLKDEFNALMIDVEASIYSRIPTTDGVLIFLENPVRDFDSKVSVSGLTLKLIQGIEYDAMCTWQIDAVGRDSDRPDADAPNPVLESILVATQLMTSLGSSAVRENLQLAGWAFISREGERKPDQVVGARWEDRTGFDVRLRCRARRIETRDVLDGATISGSLGGIDT